MGLIKDFLNKFKHGEDVQQQNIKSSISIGDRKPDYFKGKQISGILIDGKYYECNAWAHMLEIFVRVIVNEENYMTLVEYLKNNSLLGITFDERDFLRRVHFAVKFDKYDEVIYVTTHNTTVNKIELMKKICKILDVNIADIRVILR